MDTTRAILTLLGHRCLDEMTTHSTNSDVDSRQRLKARVRQLRDERSGAAREAAMKQLTEMSGIETAEIRRMLRSQGGAEQLTQRAVSAMMGRDGGAEPGAPGAPNGTPTTVVPMGPTSGAGDESDEEAPPPMVPGTRGVPPAAADGPDDDGSEEEAPPPAWDGPACPRSGGASDPTSAYVPRCERMPQRKVVRKKNRGRKRR